MKNINLLMADFSFISSPALLSDESFKNYFGLDDLKNEELSTISKLCNMLLKEKENNHYLFENYYLNYQIPQIEQKFDLLKIGVKSVVNIELRFGNIELSIILKELEKNYFYLSFFKKKVYCYAFVNNCNVVKLYFYKKETKTMQEVQISHLLKILEKIQDDNKNLLDTNTKSLTFLL